MIQVWPSLATSRSARLLLLSCVRLFIFTAAPIAEARISGM